MLPEFNAAGDLPPGVYRVGWNEFQARFGTSTLRRTWLLARLQQLLAIAVGTNRLQRVFVWGSFVTGKSSPGDIDVLLMMDNDFEVDPLPPPAQAIFDSTRAKLLFEVDVFWARASIGADVLSLWLETYQVSRAFQKRGIVELELP